MDTASQIQIIASRKGDVLRWLFDAVQAGNLGAIAILLVGIVAVGYTMWENVVSHLLPKPKLPSWAQWRRIGFGSVFCFFAACIAFWLFIESTILVFFAPVVFAILSAWCAKVCRDFSAAETIVDNDTEPKPKDVENLT